MNLKFYINVNIFQKIVANDLKSVCIHNINTLPVVIVNDIEYIC